MKPKKFLAVVIAATMIAANSIGLMPYKFVNLPVFTSNAADIVDSGECGSKDDNVVWQLDSEGTLTISGEGKMVDMDKTSIWCNDFVKTVIIESGVTHIGNASFHKCVDLTSIIISDSVTSIGDRAFWGCKSLTSITIPDSVISIGIGAFTSCNSLTTITIPDSVTSLGGNMFDLTPWREAQLEQNPFLIVNGILIDNKSVVGDFIIPDGVISIGAHVFEHENMKSITIPDSVTSIGDSAFCWCDNLSSVTLPDGLVSIGRSAFNSCESLKTISIPDSVTSIGDGAFLSCEDLTSITIPDSVTSIGDRAFGGCKSLTSITIPDGVINIGKDTFNGCTSLTSITINHPACVIYNNTSTIPDDAVIYGYTGSPAQAYAERYDRKFVSLGEAPYIPVVASGTCGENVTWTVDSDGILIISGEGEMTDWGSSSNPPWYNINEIITRIIINDGVESIGYGAFSGCKNLNSIAIPNSVTSIEDVAFSVCNNLKYVIIPASVTNIEKMSFSRCENLESITIKNPKCDIYDSDTTIFNGVASSVPYFNGTIYGYEESTAQDYAEKYDIEFISLGYMEQCGDNLYYNINGEELHIFGEGDMWDFENVISPFTEKRNEFTMVTMDEGITSIGAHAFEDCDNIEAILLPDSITSIGESAFEGCTYIGGKSAIDDNDFIGFISLPSSLESIGENAFNDTNIYDNQTWEKTGSIVKYIDDWVIGVDRNLYVENSDWCADLFYMEIKDGVVGIADSAFKNCNETASFVLPDSLKYIGENSFEGCSKLRSITIPNNVQLISRDAFNLDSLVSITFETSNCSIHESYKTLGTNAAIITIVRCENLEEYCDKYNKEIYYFPVINRYFKPERDGNGFRHAIGVGGGFENSNYDISPFANLDILSGLAQCYLNLQASAGDPGGWCFGITSTMAMNYNQVLTYEFYSNTAQSYYELGRPCENKRLLQTISFYLLSQKTCPKITYSKPTNNILDKDIEYTLQKIVECTMDIEKAYIIDYGDHAILANGCTTDEDGNYYVKLFDMNGSTTKLMFVSSDYSKFSFKVDGTEINERNYGYLAILDAGKVMAAMTKPTFEIDIPTKNTTLFFDINGSITKQKFIISDSKTGKLLQVDALNIAGLPVIPNMDFTIFSDDMEINRKRYAALEIEDDDLFTIDVQSKIVDIAICNSANQYQIVRGTNIKSIVLDLKENNMTLSGEDMDYEVMIQSGIVQANGLDETALLKGKTSGAINISAENGNISMKSDNMVSDIVIGACIDGKITENRVDNTSSMTFNIETDGKIETVFPDDSTIITTTTTEPTTTTTIMTTTTTPPTTTEPTYLLGDVNEDGSVDSSDASLVLAEYAKIQTGGAGEFSENQLKAADVNNDSVVDSSDASKILAYYAMVSTGKEPTWD